MFLQQNRVLCCFCEQGFLCVIDLQIFIFSHLKFIITGLTVQNRSIYNPNYGKFGRMFKFELNKNKISIIVIEIIDNE